MWKSKLEHRDCFMWNVLSKKLSGTMLITKGKMFSWTNKIALVYLFSWNVDLAFKAKDQQ